MKILVAGATGTVGRHLVEQLYQGGYEVRALMRNPAKAKFSSRVEAVAGNLSQPETLVKALEGVEALHLINFNGDDYAPLETGAEIMTLAEQAGVKRVTILQGGEKSSVELAAEASSLSWTFLTPVEFMANIKDWAESIRAEGVVREAFANRRSAIVHEADIAAVAAVALTQEGHGGQNYIITGPEVLTPPQMLQTIGEVIGRELRFIELTEAEAREKWTAEGYTEDVIEFFVWVHGNTPLEGYTVAPTVEGVTGRAARRFVQWATENAEHFRA